MKISQISDNVFEIFILFTESDIYEAEEIIINKKAKQSICYKMKAHFIRVVSFERNGVN